MVCLGFEPGTAGWKEQTNPLRYDAFSNSPKSSQIFWVTFERDFSAETIKNSPTCGQSYKQFTLVNYDSRVVPDLKTLHIMTLGS